MGKSARLFRNEHHKNMANLFDKICYRHSRWNVWSDFITMSAIAISNTVDHEHSESREETYRTLAKKYNEAEMQAFSDMFAEVVNAMEQNPDQDFLGELFMCLELSNDHAGQFFTPYNLCKLNAEICATELIKDKIQKSGWVAINDPACGAGALLVAFANRCRQPDIDVNYQTSVLFVAQDIDFTVGCMCYIQLSLLGCPGYVVIGDTLMHPATSYDDKGLLPRDDGNVWYTPFFFRTEWTLRRYSASRDLMFPMKREPESIPAPLPEPEPEPALNETKTGQLMFL